MNTSHGVGVRSFSVEGVLDYTYSIAKQDVRRRDEHDEERHQRKEK